MQVLRLLEHFELDMLHAAIKDALRMGTISFDAIKHLLLAHHLKTLRLPTFLREHDKQACICAAEGVDHVCYLARLAELELIDRERRMVERSIKSAKFPAVKSLDSFDFKAIPSLSTMMVLELARCEWTIGDASIGCR